MLVHVLSYTISKPSQLTILSASNVTARLAGRGDRCLLVSLVLLLARVLKRSVSGARMPSIVPNMVLSPKFSSMRKKSADQKGLPGRSDMASVKAIKASPVPSTP